MEPLFGITESVSDGATHVTLTGEIDLVAGPVIREHVDRALAADQQTEVIIDLSGVTFLDSSGIGVLVGCWRRANMAGKTLRALHARGSVADVLDMTGVTDVLAGRAHPGG